MNNRELKFRVWDKVAEQMIYPDKGYQGHYILTLNGKFHNLQNGAGESETIVMQYTGLKDSAGTEIYEGDILDVVSDGDWFDDKVYNYKTIVGYDTPTGAFTTKTWKVLKEEKETNSYTYRGAMLHYHLLNECKVLGNIYENFELCQIN